MDIIIDILDVIVQAALGIGALCIAFFIFLLLTLMMPIWIIPYGIYKYIHRKDN